MNQEGRVAVTRFVREQERFAETHRVPALISDLRRRGSERFATLGFPDSSDEAWRFTNVRPIIERAFTTSQPDRPRLGPDDLGSVVQLAGGCRLVFVDGVFSASLSTLTDLPARVVVCSLAASLDVPDLLNDVVASLDVQHDDPFAALGSAFLMDGAVVRVGRGVRLSEPISIVHASTGATNLATFPQTLIALEREAEATIVETYVGFGAAAYLTNATTTALVGEGSRLRHYRIQQEGLGAIHVATSRWTLRRDAFLESCSLALGAALARHQLVGVLDGQNAALTLDGLSLLARAQHGDHHTTIDHAQPHCESHEVFNGVFGGEARGVFNGRIIVRPGAQRTDSKQTSNNLLLSDRARADTQPQLEIYADDVKCTHGATLGPLDEMALFYLLSRGLDRVEARNALTYGFAAEILARVSDPDVRAQMDRLVRSSLIGVIGRAA